MPYEEIKKSNIPYEIIYCYLHLADVLASNGYDIRNSIRYLYDRLCIKYPRICYSKKKSEFMDKIDDNISKAIVMFNENFVEAINTFCYNDSVRDKYAELYNSVTERLNEQNG